MRKQSQLVLISLIGLFLILSFPAEVASSTLDWSDDFDDGNYDGWTVFTGAFTATGGKLMVTSLAPGDAIPWINHPSSVDFGNWTFDIDLGVNATAVRAIIVFMESDSYSYYLDALGVGWDLCRGIWPFGDSVGHFSATAEWEHHIRVERTRAEPNMFRVYHNDTLVIETSTILVPDHEWTLFEFGGIPGTPGASIDNIVVEYEEEIPTTPTPTAPTNTTTTPPPGEPLDMTTILLIAGGAAVVVIVLVAIVKMRS